MSKLSQFIHRNSRAVLMVALSVAIVSGVFGVGVASRLNPFGDTDPATRSIKAIDRYEAAAHVRIEPDVLAVINVGNVATPAAKATVTKFASQLATRPGVASVQTFYTTHNPALVSFNHRQTLVSAFFDPASDKQIQDDAKAIVANFAGEHYIKFGGYGVANAQVNQQVSQGLAHAELLAFPLIFLLSLLFFRSLIAAAMPPLVGGLAIIITMFAVRLISEVVGISVYAINFVTGIGLGLAIDYSLFIVSRYREEAALHGFGEVAMRRTLASAGRTIMFSAVTVAASVASLALFPQEFLYSMGIAGAIAVLLAMAIALTVLPAILLLLGPKINWGAPKFLARRQQQEAQHMESGFWYRLSHFVMKRPGRVAIASAAVMLVLGIPFLGIKFITATPKVLPTSASARQVDTTLNTDFPSGQDNPVDIVLGAPAQSAAVATLRARIATLPDVASVAPAQPAGSSNSVVYAFEKQAPLSASSEQLVRAIRAIHTPYYLGVAGDTAAFLDLESSLKSHLPLVVLVVLLSTLLVLFLMTGSVILPIKAVLMNGLTLSAMLGILTWVFQDGHLQGLLGFSSEGAMDATTPVFLGAIGFGLATDYGVFLLSRIKEAHDAGKSNRESVALGLERTGRIVTAAAMLFAVAIGAFVTSNIIFIKELGLGAALSVLLDATIIRALLVPALMALLGPANWWAPKPLRWLHDRIGFNEGPSLPVAAVSAPVSEAQPA